jgi:hypothetical protein
MTLREIQTGTLMMEPGFTGGGTSSFELAASIEVCPPISRLAAKDTQTHARGDFSKTQFPPSGEDIPDDSAITPVDHFELDCKPDSIPI